VEAAYLRLLQKAVNAMRDSAWGDRCCFTLLNAHYSACVIAIISIIRYFLAPNSLHLSMPKSHYRFSHSYAYLLQRKVSTLLGN
jgi:hypothetical protein